MMYKMMKSGKVGFFATSVLRNYYPSVVAYAPPSRRLWHTKPGLSDPRDFDRPYPILDEVDLFDRPLPTPKVLSIIETMERLTEAEKFEYRFIFSKMLGLPSPPRTPRGADETFLVKLVNFDKDEYYPVLGVVALAKTTEDKTSLSQYYLRECHQIVRNLPSIVKQYVTKEEAQDIVAKLKAAGGHAVIEEVEEEEEEKED